MKVVVDANVLLDVLLDRQPWADDASALWDSVHSGAIEGIVVATAITNLFYICRRTVGTDLALQGVVRCLSTFDVLQVDHSALLGACGEPGADYEDNVTIRCALAANIDVIASRDLTGFTQSPVAARLPAEILKGLS